MADGIVTIDIDMPLDKFKSDMQVAKELIKGLGENAGDKMDDEFKKSSDKVVADSKKTKKDVDQEWEKPIEVFYPKADGSKAKDEIKKAKSDIDQEWEKPTEVFYPKADGSKAENEVKKTKKDIDGELKKPTAPIKPKVDSSDAQEGTQKIITSLRKLPKAQKVKLEADAKKAGIDNFISFLHKVPKKKRVEILTKAQKGEAIDYEKLLNRLPHKVATKAELNDNASSKLKKIQSEAKETESKFSRLKTVIAGTFIGSLGADIARDAFNTVKESIGGVITQGLEFNRLQQTMTASWITLTGSAKEGQKLVDMTNDLAVSAQNSTEMVNELNQRFYAVTNNADKTKELSKSVLTLQDAFGQSDDAVKNFSTQWSQMVGNGKASAQDMLSIQNVFPKFRQELLDYEKQVTGNSNLTMEQLNDMMSAGKISADTMNTVLIGMGNKYKDATKNFGSTLDGMERTIKARIPILAGKIVKPFQELKNPLLGKMSDWVNSSGAEKAATNLGKKISDAIGSALTFIDKHKDALMSIGKSLADIGKTVGGAVWNIFKGVIEAIGDALGKFSKNTKDSAGPLEKIASGLSAISKHKTAIKATTGAFVGMLAAIKAFKVAKSIFDGVSKAIDILPDKAKAAGLAMKAAGVATKTWSGITKIATGIQAAFNAVMAINPVILIVGAIIALGVAVYAAYKHFKPFRDAVNKAWDAIKKFGSSIAKIGKNIYDGLVKSLSGVVSWVKKWAKKAGDGIVKGFQAVMKPLSKVWDGIKKAAEFAFKAVGVVILAPIVLVAATIVAIWKKVHGPLEKAWNAISKTASNVWNGIKKVTSKVWNGIKDAVVKVAKAIFSPVKKAFSKLGSWIGDKWDGIKKSTSEKWGHVKDTVGKMSKKAKDVGGKYVDLLKQDVGNKWDHIKKFTSEKWGHVKDTVGKMSEKAKDVGGKYLEVLKQDVGSKWDTVKSTTSSAWGKVSDYVSEHSDTARKNAGKNFSSLKEKMSDILDSISRTWKKVWGNISDYFSDIWDGIKKHAKNGLNSVIDFLNGGIGGINNVVHFFGGKKQTISPIPKLAKGGRMSKSTLALVNDEESSTYREAIFRKDGSVELPQERNVLTHLEAGDAVMPAKQTAMLLGLPQYKGGFGDWLGKAADWIGDVGGDIGDWLADKIDQLEEALKDPLGALMGLFKKSKNNAEAVWHDIGEGAGKYVPESAVDWFKNILAGFKKKFDESGGSNPPGEGVERWRGSVKKALAKLGLSTSEDMVNKVLRQIQTESGGNPKAKQSGADPDGDGSGPALGLMQTKRGTFQNNALPGHGDLWNGFDNILAGLNYARKRYGDSLYFLGQGHGYANGGHIYDKQLAWIAEDGDEFVINNRKPNADSLLASAIKQRAEINPNSFSAKIAHIIDSAKFSGSNGYNVSPSTITPDNVVRVVQGDNSVDYSQQIEDINRKLDIIADKQVKVDGRSFAVAYEKYGSHERNQRDVLGQRGLAVDVNF